MERIVKLSAVCVWSIMGAVALVGCDQLGCQGRATELDGPRLEYTLRFEAAFDKQLRSHGRRLVAAVENRDPELDVEVDYDDGLVVQTSAPEGVDLVETVIGENHPELEQVERDGGRVVYEITDTSAESYRSMWTRETVQAVTERLHAEGLGDVAATKLGDTGLVIALPSERSDAVERVKAIAEDFRTLAFTFVDDERAHSFFGELEGELPAPAKVCDVAGTPTVVRKGRVEAKAALEAFFEGRVPEGRRIGYQFVPRKDETADEEESGGGSESVMNLDKGGGVETCTPDSGYWRTYLLEEKPQLEGHHVLDARVATDQQTSTPVVDITFTKKGADLLAETTREGVDRRLAMVVGDFVHTAPVINEPIRAGRLRLNTGVLQSYREKYSEVRDLANMLRAQSAPLELELKGVDRDAGSR